jgi:hypothetical protein
MRRSRRDKVVARHGAQLALEHVGHVIECMGPGGDFGRTVLHKPPRITGKTIDRKGNNIWQCHIMCFHRVGVEFMSCEGKAVADHRRCAPSGQPVPTSGIGARQFSVAVEESGWSSPPWPKHAWKEDLEKKMDDRGMSVMNDSRHLIKEMTTTGVWPILRAWIAIEFITEQTGRLMLTKEEWLSKYHHHLNSKSSSGTHDKSGSYNPSKQKAVGYGDKKEPIIKLTSEGMPQRKGRCRNCGIYGHWKQDCKCPRKDCREEAHHV